MQGEGQAIKILSRASELLVPLVSSINCFSGCCLSNITNSVVFSFLSSSYISLQARAISIVPGNKGYGKKRTAETHAVYVLLMFAMVNKQDI